jgi:hypothetical protein
VADIQNSEVDVMHLPFSLAQQWVTVSKHNEGILFILEQKGHRGIIGLKYDVWKCNNGNQGM